MTEKSNEPSASGASKPARKRPVRLKDVAEHLGLSPATVSLVLNRSPVADSIPPETHERVFAAARELDYRPSFLARSLRNQRTYSIGVVVPEFSEGYAAGVTRGLEKHLLSEGYFYLMASHQSEPRILAEAIDGLQERQVDGLILLAANLESPPALPTVVVSGHRQIEGVTNVRLNQDLAASQALGHLAELGHEKIAFSRGPSHNADANDRWRAIVETAKAMGLEIRPELVLELGVKSYGEAFYRDGYTRAQELVRRSSEFTAFFAFDDFVAIGAMKAFFEAGLRVPEDISVVGFDDINSAAFTHPSLTTVRQPLREMGKIAGRIVLEKLAGADAPGEILIEPQLVVRESTSPVPVTMSPQAS